MWNLHRLVRRPRPPAPLPDALWEATLARLPWLHDLAAADLARLRELAALFLRDKKIVGAHDFPVDDELRLAIAMQACRVVLQLGMEWYRGWHTVIVYPDEFIVDHEFVDDDGVVHARRDIRTGESWLGGPLLLAASEIFHDGRDDGVNVVIHEFAHKLDMLNGDANGYPPLHRDMSRAQWTSVFIHAYDDFCARVDRGEDTRIDPYASDDPAEFFAVVCEAFFLTPAVLRAEYPDVFQLLTQFFRANEPGARPVR